MFLIMRKVDNKEQAKQREERVLNNWKQNDTFQKSIKNREGCKTFVTYDGPPTANGSPHIGHVLGRVIKDTIGRYKTMTGHKVIRKAGWDTHGLPVELGVEKQLGISGKQDIENYGVEAFIKKCKDSVFKYEKEWRELTESIGYWVDMDNPYITLDNNYIESVWNILSQIHKKGLLYKGHRVSPYCPSCQTSLSSHEVGQGYEDVKDLSATVKFKNKYGEFFLAWTTTPWTLPGNVALAINKNLTYVKVKKDNEIYIVSESLIDKVFKSDYKVISNHLGEEFLGDKYESPYQFFNLEKGHIIIHGDFVSDKSGTGIVHIAPAYGEDDYKVSKQNNLSFIHPVNLEGKYVNEVTPFAGRFVKDNQMDVDIVKDLSHRGLLFHKEKYEHSYPHCWRCKTPLLYYATESWYIKTTAIKEELMKNNNEIEWYPSHIKEGRFGNFLNELVDWNISRNRYWGTPLNVWQCECGQEFCPGSIDELKEKAIKKIEKLELHKPYVDEVEVKCDCGKTMKRTPEVIDVWFDSGAMPYAQYHTPFENHDVFKEQFPADMICEGIDQTRGWFYSLLAVSTLLNGKSPYKRVMALGHVLDEQGQKMSKSKGNVVNPWDIIREYGSDAFRWALLSDSSPWSSKKFSKTIVSEAKSKMIDTLVNVHSFLAMYATIDHFNYQEHTAKNVKSVMDKWILSKIHSTIKEVKKDLEQYEFVRPLKLIEKFIDELSNWYVRRSRERFWASGMEQDKINAYHTLREVLLLTSRLVAPFIPFVADDIYQNLTESNQSVHLTDFPNYNESLINTDLENKMEQVLQVVELARSIRNENNIRTKQPLSKMYVFSNSNIDFSEFNSIVQDEINVKNIIKVENDELFADYNVKPNFKTAGPKLGKSISKLQNYLKRLSLSETKELLLKNSFKVEDIEVSKEDLLVEKKSKEGFASATNQNFSIALDIILTEELLQEGFVREVVRAIQEQRKKLAFNVEDYVNLTFNVNEQTKSVLEKHIQYLKHNLLTKNISFANKENTEYIEILGDQLGIAIDLA